MLGLFRKYGVHIAIGIVFFFIVTLFSGAFFFSDFSKEKASLDQRSPDQIVGQVGEDVISKTIYYNRLQEFLLNRRSQVGHLTFYNPEELEYIKLLAFKKSIDHVLILEEAKRHKIKATKKEFNYSLTHSIYTQFNITSKKELMALLKKNNISYKEFKQNIEEEIMIRKFLNAQTGDVSVTPQAVQDSFVSLRMNYLFLSTAADATEEEKVQTYQQALGYLKDLTNGKSSFSALKKSLSGSDMIQIKTKVSVSYANLIKPLRDRAYALSNKEYSGIIKTDFGLYIIQVLDRKTLPKPVPFEETAAMQELQQRLVSTEIDHFIQSLKRGKVVNVTQADLMAVDFKLNGDYDRAIGAYNRLISAAPNNPIPHLMIAGIHLERNELKFAEKAFKKAEIKIELMPVFETPYYYTLKARFYKQKKWMKSYARTLDKGISHFKGNLIANQYLKAYFEQIKDDKRLSIVTKELKALEEKIAKEKVADEAAPLNQN